jgi:hypothetical protein
MRLKQICVVVLLGAATAMAGCFGGGADVENQVSTVSQGKELTDLKLALDMGAISADEYDRLRKKILSRR